MTNLIAEDLVLLLLDDETGKLEHSTYLDTGIGGALLVELALAENVSVVKDSGFLARSKVHVSSAPPPTDPVLAEALALVGEKPRTAEDLVGRLGKKRRDVLLDRLRQRGILEEKEHLALGLIPRKRWPTVDSTHEAEVRRSLGDALRRDVRPDQRTAALVSLLSALDLAHKVVDREGHSGREVKKRAKEIAEGDWSAKAVSDAVAAAQAAVTAAIVASTAATTAATSGT
jgi:hypothetical protein